jgi:hypothetical protein
MCVRPGANVSRPQHFWLAAQYNPLCGEEGLQPLDLACAISAGEAILSLRMGEVEDIPAAPGDLGELTVSLRSSSVKIRTASLQTLQQRLADDGK